MANTISEILGRNIDSVKSLKQAIKNLQDSLVGLDANSQEYKTTSEQLSAAQAELTKVTRAGKEENNAAKDSIVGLEKEYKELYNTYKMLTEEQRNSDFGKGMAESLNTLSTKLNDTKKEVGNFKDNIGRYAQSATEAFNGMGVSIGGLQTPMKLASGGAKTLGTALKSLAANPIVMFVTALVAILAKASAAIKDNEELTNRLKVAMAALKPITDLIANAFDALAGVIVKVVEGFGKAVEWISKISPKWNAAVKSHQELAKATNDLTKAQRENSVVASQKTAEIERLREEASATDDVVEKKKLLEEAKALQAEVDAKNVELAQEELRIMQEYADKTANSAEENEKLAAAQKKVNDAIAQGERNMRLYNKQLNTVTNTTKSGGSATKNYREEAKKLYEELVRGSKTEIQLTTEKYKKEKALLEKYNFDTKLLTKKYEEDIQKLRAEEWKKEHDALRAMFSEYAENLKRYYNNLKTMAIANEDTTRVPLIDAEQLAQAYDQVADYVLKVYKLIGDSNDKLGNALLTLFDNADMSKLADWDYVEGILKSFGDDEALKEFYTFGKEGWREFIGGFQSDVEDIKDAFGIDIRNLPDAEAAWMKLGHDLSEKFGEAAQTEIERQKRDMTIGLYEAMYDMLKNNTSESGGVIYEMVRDYVKGGEYAMLEAERDALQIQLENFSGTTEQKIAMLEQYYSVVDELRQRDLAAEELAAQRNLAIYNAAFDRYNAMKSAVSSVVDAMQAYIQSEIDSGKLTERESKRKQKALQNLEKVQLAVAVSTIAANTAGAIIDVWRGYSAELPANAATAAATGPYTAPAVKAGLDAKSLASAILRTGAISMEGTAQIAAAVGGYISRSKSFSDAGGGVEAGVAATPALIDSSAYSYVKTIQDTPPEDEFNKVNLWVSVTDIQEGLNHKAQVTQESSF